MANVFRNATLFIFNKLYRTEVKFISSLAFNIAKSKSFAFTITENKNKCELDKIDIVFHKNEPKKMVISDKGGNEITTIDCNSQSEEKLQQARADWFYKLLKVALKRDAVEKKKKNIKDKFIKAKNIIAPSGREKAQQDAKKIELNEALKKIKGIQR